MTRVIDNARANEDSIPVQRRRCHDCGHTFLTATVIIPPGTTLGRLDELYRLDVRRRKATQRGSPQQLRPRHCLELSDLLDITVKVRRPRRLRPLLEQEEQLA